MTNTEKIIELLSRKNLTEEEQVLLNSLLRDSDPELPGKYEMLKNIVKKSSHLTADEIADYILIRNNMEPSDKSSLNKIKLMEAHINDCAVCKSEYNELAVEYAGTEEFLSGCFQTERGQPQFSAGSEPVFRERRKFSNYAFRLVLMVLIAAASLFTISEITEPGYYHYASVSDEDEHFVTRGRGTEDFDRSVVALEEKNYDEAILSLKKDIKKSAGSETLFYSHYILGLTYLEKSEKSFLGLFKSFDRNYAGLARKEFYKTIELNDSGRYGNINLNARFYAAKAGLMLGDVETAKREFSMVVENKGSRMADAKEILKSLD